MKRQKILFLLIANIFFFTFFYSPVSAQVVINEFVPDADTEWIEFYNASDSAEFIKNYWIDDDTDFNSDSGSSAKKSLADLIISSIAYPYFDLSSSIFNNNGDKVVLFNESGQVLDEYTYTDNPGKDISIGRNPDRNGSFTILALATKSSQNSEPPTSTPTVTPSPTPTPTPSKTPTPIPAQDPTKTPTPVKSPTPIPNTSTPTPKPNTPTPKKSITPSPTESEEATEGAILGNESASSTSMTLADEEVATDTAAKKSSISPWIFVGFGGLCLFGMTVSALLIAKKKNLI